MSAYQFYEGYPDFHRSPRIIYRSSEDKITVNAPGNEPNKSKDELLKLIVPPLVMIGVSILISIFRPYFYFSSSWYLYHCNNVNGSSDDDFLYHWLL